MSGTFSNKSLLIYTFVFALIYFCFGFVDWHDKTGHKNGDINNNKLTVGFKNIAH